MILVELTFSLTALCLYYVSVITEPSIVVQYRMCMFVLVQDCPELAWLLSGICSGGGEGYCIWPLAISMADRRMCCCHLPFSEVGGEGYTVLHLYSWVEKGTAILWMTHGIGLNVIDL